LIGFDMQTVAFDSKWLRGLLIAALYVSVFGCATPRAPTPKVQRPATAAPAPTKVQAPAPAAIPQPALIPAVVPVVVPVITPASTEPVESHIALILPLKSATFASKAEVVQQGFLAAAALQTNGIPVRVYPCKDEKLEVVALYQQALKAGAVAVVGPLTIPGVTALAANTNLVVPTLALNVIEAERNDQLYFFGLPGETEARQVAQWATKSGMLSATVVRTDTAFSKRLAKAFTLNWQRAGGQVKPEIVYSGDPKPLRAIPADPGNMVFLAAEVDKARLLRPYINVALPLYATSQVYAGNGNNLVNFDLAEVHFVDMPWVLQPDHPAVMVYPRVTPPLAQDMERLYAFGIDAYRLMQVVLQHDTEKALPLDGVTGKVYLYGHVLERESIYAAVRQGQGVPLEGKSQQTVSKSQQ
jgi:outer membrane PBP1 activator LpoA protein